MLISQARAKMADCQLKQFPVQKHGQVFSGMSAVRTCRDSEMKLEDNANLRRTIRGSLQHGRASRRSESAIGLFACMCFRSDV